MSQKIFLSPPKNFFPKNNFCQKFFFSLIGNPRWPPGGVFSEKKIGNFFYPKINSGHFGQKNFFGFPKYFPAKTFFFVCIRHFSDVFGPRSKALYTSALKLSTMDNMLIIMNFLDFWPDRKFKMAARGRFSRTNFFVSNPF